MLLPSGRLYQSTFFSTSRRGQIRLMGGLEEPTDLPRLTYRDILCMKSPGLRWVPCQRHWGLIKNGIVNFHSTFRLRFEFIGRSAAKEKCSTLTVIETSKRRHHIIWFSYVRHGYISVRNFITFLECIQ